MRLMPSKNGSVDPEIDATAQGADLTYGARHVAIIMDGNGRWAKRKHLPRSLGHKKGVEAVRNIVRAAGEVGIEVLTLYAFSSENWSRPAEEVTDLMGLLRQYIQSDIDEFDENGIRLKIIGNYKALDRDIVDLIDNALERTNQKFIYRFNYMEQKVKEQGRSLKEMTLDEMEQIWQEAKRV